MIRDYLLSRAHARLAQKIAERKELSDITSNLKETNVTFINRQVELAGEIAALKSMLGVADDERI